MDNDNREQRMSSDMPGANRIREFFSRHWKPTPITPPAVDPQLEEMNGLQRSAEVFRYSILSAEWWLSPNGTLREWFKLNGKVGSVLLIPAVLVIPLITFILWQVGTWIVILVGIAGHLIILPLALILAAGAVGAAVALFRSIFSK